MVDRKENAVSFYWRFVRPITFALEARSLRAFAWRCAYGARLMVRGR